MAVAAAALGAGALTLLYAWRVERAQVRLDRFTVGLAGADLPPGGLTILHLSDCHFRAAGAVQARKIAALRRLLDGERYDVLALTGDLIHDAAGFGVAFDLIAGLRPRLAAFYVPGNHDYAEYSVGGVFGHTWRGSGGAAALGADLWRAGGKLLAFAGKVARNDLVRLPVAFNDVPAMAAALAEAGVQPLINQAVRLSVGGADLWFAGVDDTLEGQPDLGAALASVPPGAALILLAHNPDAWLDARADRAGLVLSGHTHGGQVRLPLLGALHTQGTHLSRRRPAGWFQRGATRLFVTRGLGESLPIRLGAAPQVALITMTSDG